MATFTFEYQAKKKPPPVVDQLSEVSSTDTECSITDVVNYTIIGTKWLEVVSSDASAYVTGAIPGSISGSGTLTIIIDKFKSFDPGQNTFSDSVTVNIRASDGGAIEDRYILSRDHTDVNC